VTRGDDTQNAPLPECRLIYDAALGDGMDRLASPIRDFHRAAAPARFGGRAAVVRGGNPLAQLVAVVMGMPRASADCAIEVVVTRAPSGTETWSRSFDGKGMVSRQELGAGRWAGLVVERIGAMAFAYAVIERGGELHLDIRGWTALGLPMPLWLGPRAVAFEHGADGRFNFDVDMALPLIGRIVHYRGWLVPVP